MPSAVAVMPLLQAKNISGSRTSVSLIPLFTFDRACRKMRPFYSSRRARRNNRRKVGLMPDMTLRLAGWFGA